jgi:hypothetical protein
MNVPKQGVRNFDNLPLPSSFLIVTATINTTPRCQQRRKIRGAINHETLQHDTPHKIAQDF